MTTEKENSAVRPVVIMGSLVREGDLHKRLSLGCQDSCQLVALSDVRIGVVCDGCSSTKERFTQNQVGAVLGAQFIATHLARMLEAEQVSTDEGFRRALRKTETATLRFFRAVRNGMRLDAAEEREFVLTKLIFTVLGVAMVPTRYWIFGLGDGCFGIDTELQLLDTPQTFLNCRVLRDYQYGRSNKPCLVVHSAGPVAGMKCIWVATDGMTGLLGCEDGKRSFSEFLSDEYACAKDSDGNDTTIQAFRRRLHRQHASLFSDDVAIALMKLRPSPAAYLNNGEGEEDESGRENDSTA